MKKLAIAMIAAMSLSFAAFANDHAATTETPAATEGATKTEVTTTEKSEHKGHDGKTHKMHKKTMKSHKTTEEAHHE